MSFQLPDLDGEDILDLATADYFERFGIDAMQPNRRLSRMVAKDEEPIYVHLRNVKGLLAKYLVEYVCEPFIATDLNHVPQMALRLTLVDDQSVVEVPIEDLENEEIHQ